MSRNKVILILAVLAMAYVLTPATGTWYIVKHNIIMALPYVLLLVIIYLVVTINMLKHRWKKPDSSLTDENVMEFAKMINITFDVKRMLGSSNLIDLYNKVNFSTRVSLHAKQRGIQRCQLRIQSREPSHTAHHQEEDQDQRADHDESLNDVSPGNGEVAAYERIEQNNCASYDAPLSCRSDPFQKNKRCRP